MSYKLGLLLSMFFLVQVFLLGGDLASITAIHNQIDAIALTAGYQISLQGSLPSRLFDPINREHGPRRSGGEDLLRQRRTALQTLWRDGRIPGLKRLQAVRHVA